MRAVPVVLCGLLCWALVGCGAHNPTTRATVPQALAATRGNQLTPAERERLRAGERVEHPRRFLDSGSQYVGGLSYQLVAADPDEVLHALLDPGQLEQMLPHTKHIAAIGPGY